MFEIDGMQVTNTDVFTANEPTRREMAAFCSTLGLLIGNRVTILEAIIVTAKSTNHPWLVAVLDRVYLGLREGRCITSSVNLALTGFVAERVAEISHYELDSETLDPTTPHQLTIPDFFGFFGDFIKLVDAGEESGALHVALHRVRDINLNDGIVDGYQSPWERDVSLFCSALELLYSNGLSEIDSLKVIRKTSVLRDEIDIAIRHLKKGKTLAEALKRAEGRLADQVLLALIKMADDSNKLPVTLTRIHREN